MLKKYLNAKLMLEELRASKVNSSEKVVLLLIAFFPFASEKLNASSVSGVWTDIMFLISLLFLWIFLKNKDNVIEEYVAVFSVAILIAYVVVCPVSIIMDSMLKGLVSNNVLQKIFEVLITLCLAVYPVSTLLLNQKEAH